MAQYSLRLHPLHLCTRVYAQRYMFSISASSWQGESAIIVPSRTSDATPLKDADCGICGVLEVPLLWPGLAKVARFHPGTSPEAARPRIQARSEVERMNNTMTSLWACTSIGIDDEAQTAWAAIEAMTYTRGQQISRITGGSQAVHDGVQTESPRQ